MGGDNGPDISIFDPIHVWYMKLLGRFRVKGDFFVLHARNSLVNYKHFSLLTGLAIGAVGGVIGQDISVSKLSRRIRPTTRISRAICD